MSMCRVFSCVVREGCLLWPLGSLGKILLALCPASFCIPRPNLPVTPVFLFFLIFIFALFYFTILYWFCHTLTWIHHGCTCDPKHEPPSHLPPHNIPLGRPRAPAPSMLYPASDIDWWFDSYMIVHVSMPFSQIIPPSPSPSESKSPLYTSVSFLLSCIQGHHCHLSKFHIHVLVYCIGVFLSGLLHSV